MFLTTYKAWLLPPAKLAIARPALQNVFTLVTKDGSAYPEEYSCHQAHHHFVSWFPSQLPPASQQVGFSIDVIVDEDGSPQLLLETGTEDRAATFYAGNGTSVLTFRSTVQVCSFASQQQDKHLSEIPASYATYLWLRCLRMQSGSVEYSSMRRGGVSGHGRTTQRGAISGQSSRCLEPSIFYRCFFPPQCFVDLLERQSQKIFDQCNNHYWQADVAP